jgi:tubulin-folding cofactor B
MSDEEYDKREGTLRAFKREQLAKDPTFKFFPKKASGEPEGEDKPDVMSEECVAGIKVRMWLLFLPVPTSEGALHSRPHIINPPRCTDLPVVQVGDRCEVKPGGRRGEVKYVGHVVQIAPGFWVRVQQE